MSLLLLLVIKIVSLMLLIVQNTSLMIERKILDIFVSRCCQRCNCVMPIRTFLTGFSFDGTTNVQNVASLLEKYFSCCTVSTGVELTVSFIADKVMAIWPMREMCGFATKMSHLLCLLASLHTLDILTLDCFPWINIQISAPSTTHSCCQEHN